MKKVVKKIVLTLWLVLGVIFGGIISEASGEKASFGSEGYEWVLDEASPIGVHISSEQLIGYSEVYVKYDSGMLEYSSGGEVVENGLLKVTAGDGTLQEYSTMLEFVPRVAGSTQIMIQSGFIQNAAGESVELGQMSVPVNIPIPEGCRLSGIQINGTEITGVDGGQTLYAVEVENSIENAVVTASAENGTAQIEITDTTLAVGENQIFIIVTNEAGNRARYVLHVTRKEPVKDAEEKADVTEETSEQSKAEPVVIQQAEPGNIGRNKAMILVATVILGLILLGLVCIEIKIIRKKIRKKDQKIFKEEMTWDVEEMTRDVEDELEETEDFEHLEEFALFDNREIEIAVRNVTMEFKREKDESTSIKELLIRTAKGERSYEKFKALDNVSFIVKKGEVVGIIGTNGSGKSTILKIISGALKPTSGTVEVDKNKIQLLTLGTGFDYELTGRENVYLNGAIIGYTKEFIDEKYDEIVKFAELEGFMEEKVRNYSSGMVSRLGFAIATVRDTPEILILDEVLSVGDMFFRKKSNARIKEMMKGGSTVLIVSHSTSVIRENCTKAIWIEKGILKSIGEPAEVCQAYEKMNG